MKKSLKKSIAGFLISFVFLFSCFSQEVDPAQEKFQIASGAFSDQFYEAALSLFKRFIEEFPQSDLAAQAKLYTAKCLYHRQNFSESMAQLQKLKKEGYSELNDQIDYWIAKIFFKKNDFSNCLNQLKKITKNYDSPYYQKANFLQARSYLETNQIKKAESNLKKIIEESPNRDLVDQAYQNLLQIYAKENDFHKISSSAKKYLKDNPQTKIKDRLYFYLADAYRKKNYFKQAINYYNRAIEATASPGLRDRIYQGLGLAYLNQNESALAKRTIDKIVDSQLRLFSQGLYYFNNNDYIQALESFSAYLNQFPEGDSSAQAYLKKGDILYEMGRINDSLSTYKAVLAKFPKQKEIRNEAHYGLAWCYLKNSNFKRAIAEFKKTLEYSDDPAVKISSRIQMADVYQESGQYQKALNTYKQIISDYPNTLYADYIQFQIGMIFIKKKMLEEGFLAFRNLTMNFPNSKLIPEAKYYLAVGYFSQDKYKRAQKLLDSLMAGYPNSEIIPEARYLHAKCLFNQKEYGQALKVFQQIRTEHKNLAIAELAYIDTGLTYLNLEEFAKAKNIYQEFLKIYPDSEYVNSVNFYLGGIYEKEENFNQAEKYYQKISQAQTDTLVSQEALLSLGHLAWNQGNLEKAEKYFKKGAEKDTVFGLKSKLYLAKTYQQKQQNEKALELYQQLIDSQSNFAKIAMIDKAFLLKDLKKYQKAIPAFKKALEDGAPSPQVRFALGICLEKEKFDQEAIQQYFKLIYTYPASGQDDSETNYKIKAYFRIAKIYESQNNPDQAQKAYQKIIDLGVKESKIAKMRLEKLKAYSK